MIDRNNHPNRPLGHHMRRVLPLIALALVTAPTAANGARIDASYGNGGYASSSVLSNGTAAWLDRGGRVLVAGEGSGGPGVLRLTPAGRHDTRFGRSGGVALPRTFNEFATPFGVRRGRDGLIRLAALGVSFSPPVALLRFGPGGTPLSVRFHTRALDDAVVADPVAGVQKRDGGAYVLATNGRLRAVTRAAGTDTRFAGGTVEVAPGIRSFSSPPALALRRNGRVLVALRDDGGAAVLQFTRRGVPDPAFGTNGRVRVPFHARALEVLRNGDVAGAAGSNSRIARVFRLTKRGRLRRGFGSGGTARGRTDRFGGSVTDIVQGRRGRLYVLAYGPQGNNSGVAAFSRRGRRLRSFGPRGARILPAAPEGERNLANRLLLDGRRGLLVIGSKQTYVCDDRQDLECDFYADTLAVWRFRL